MRQKKMKQKNDIFIYKSEQKKKRVYQESRKQDNQAESHSVLSSEEDRNNVEKRDYM